MADGSLSSKIGKLQFYNRQHLIGENKVNYAAGNCKKGHVKKLENMTENSFYFLKKLFCAPNINIWIVLL